MPLVLDGDGRLYLHRCWITSVKVADGILLRSAVRYMDDETPVGRAGADTSSTEGEPDRRREAARLALTRGFPSFPAVPAPARALP